MSYVYVDSNSPLRRRLCSEVRSPCFTNSGLPGYPLPWTRAVTPTSTFGARHRMQASPTTSPALLFVLTESHPIRACAWLSSSQANSFLVNAILRGNLAQGRMSPQSFWFNSELLCWPIIVLIRLAASIPPSPSDCSKVPHSQFPHVGRFHSLIHISAMKNLPHTLLPSFHLVLRPISSPSRRLWFHSVPNQLLPSVLWEPPYHNPLRRLGAPVGCTPACERETEQRETPPLVFQGLSPRFPTPGTSSTVSNGLPPSSNWDLAQNKHTTCPNLSPIPCPRSSLIRTRHYPP